MLTESGTEMLMEAILMEQGVFWPLNLTEYYICHKFTMLRYIFSLLPCKLNKVAFVFLS